MKFHLGRYAAVALMSAVMGVPLAWGADAPAKAKAEVKSEAKVTKAADKEKKAAKYDLMDYGPFLSASFVSSPLASFNGESGAFTTDSTARGIIIKLDEGWNAGIVFDADTMRMSAGWVGGPIWFRGLIGDGGHGWDPMPKVLPAFQTPNGPGWADAKGSFEDPREDSIAPLPRPGHLPKEWAHYTGLYRHGDQVVLSYTVNGAKVLESPSMEKEGAAAVFVRSIQMDGITTVNGVMIADGNPVVPPQKATKDKSGKQTQEFTVASVNLTTAINGTTAELGDLHIAVIGAPEGSKLNVDEKHRLSLSLPANAAKAEFRIYLAGGGEATKADFGKLVMGQKKQPDLVALTKGGPSLWTKDIETKGVLAAEGKKNEPYVIDTLTIPYENPYHSWMRVAALDFFPDGTRAAVTTWSGDVWIVSGIDESLEHLKWKRFATGLHQPLGLKIVDGTIYVVGHDQITKLHDLDGDGEADFYENFNNDWELTAAFHAFAFDLQTDKEGNFYFAFGSPVRNGGRQFQKITKDHGCILKVSKDGSKIEHYAEGLRAPNGMGISPDGQITIGDNQGSWVPYDPLYFVKPGQFLGQAESAHRPMKSDLTKTDPSEMPKPLCWLLYKEHDNSNGGQVWVPSDNWGPFKGELLYCSYGKSALFKVLKEEVNGVMQGGVARITSKFTSSAMRPRFNPKDGQLYVTGLKGWQTNAGQDGGFDRVRYTGAPVNLPTGLHVTKKGIFITFTSPLETATANDPTSFTAQAWNIKWSAAYGSDDYPLSSNPWGEKPKKGRDEWAIRSSSLSPDGKTIFLEIPEIQKANCVHITYNINAADGTALKGDLANTIHELADQ